MFVKTFILDGNDCMLHIQRNLADRYRHTVGIGSGQFLKLITICIIHEGGISTGHDVYIRDIRSSIENSTEGANPHATEDHTYCSKTQKQNAQKSDTRLFSSFRGGGRQLFSLFLGGIFSKIHLCTSFILLIIANFKIQ